MAANPPLTRTFDNSLAPTPYQGESIVLRRDCIDLKLSDLRTASGKCEQRPLRATRLSHENSKFSRTPVRQQRRCLDSDMALQVERARQLVSDKHAARLHCKPARCRVWCVLTPSTRWMC